MTTRTPRTVWYEYFAVIGPEVLDVENIVVSADVDRPVYGRAVLTLANVTEAAFQLLDPRDTDPANAEPLYWRVEQWSDDGMIASLPADVFQPPDVAVMYVRSVSRNHLNGTVDVEVATKEAFLEDKRRISANPIDTGATTVTELVHWAVSDTFTGNTLSSIPVADSTTIPAGDRRKQFPGETHAELIQPELDAIDCRLTCSWGGLWVIQKRGTASTTTLRLCTTEDGPADADPIIIDVVEELSRETDWYDGVLIEFTYTDGAGDTITEYQASGAGVNTRGVVLTRERPKPTGNVANWVQARTVTRGYDIEVDARIRLDLSLCGQAPPEMALQPIRIIFTDRNIDARIRSCEWDFAAGTMRIRAQTGNPIT